MANQEAIAKIEKVVAWILVIAVERIRRNQMTDMCQRMCSSNLLIKVVCVSHKGIKV